MKRIHIILGLLFLFMSCSSNKSWTNEEQKSYDEILSLYPDSLVTHFPSVSNPKFDIAFYSFAFHRGRCLSYIHLGIVFHQQDDMVLLEKQIQIVSKEIVSYQDSCLYIPYDYRTYQIEKEDSIRNIGLEYKLPISNLYKWGYNFTPTFYDKAITYVLNAGKGCFLPDSCLSVNGVGLPKGWEHGYTKGVTMADNLVIYWLEVW